MVISDLPPELHELYEIHEWRHASAVMMKDFPQELEEIVQVLMEFRLRKSHIVVPGGSKSLIAAAIDGPLTSLGWKEHKFETSITVDQYLVESPTHKVDCFKSKVGLEIKWNNKDPFYDRDLNNFRLLFELRALSVGVIVTRCDDLQAIFNRLGKGKSYGNSTTHMGKLLPRLNGGGGGGCPILVFGISSNLYEDDVPDAEIESLIVEFRAAQKAKWLTTGEIVTKYFDISDLRRTPPPEDEP